MKLWALADPHLGQAVDKPMDFFGARWDRHCERLAENWQRLVGTEDLVLLPGDISWALRLEEAIPDLRFLHELPGRKLLLRGNHDFWWQSLQKLRQCCRAEGFDSLDFLQNDARRYEAVELQPGQTQGLVVLGSRLWTQPDEPRTTGQDHKIYKRELDRLRLSIQAAGKLRRPGDALLAMLHYPPLTRQLRPDQASDLLHEAGVEICLYGHIHRADSPYVLTGQAIEGISYTIVAADQLGFEPYLVERERPHD